MRDFAIPDSPLTDVPLTELIACPHCDAVYKLKMPANGERAICQRCHSVLIAPRRKAGMQIIALAFASLILIVAASFTPFLAIQVAGFGHAASIFDAALAFSDGPFAVMSLAVLALIILIPLIRLLLTLYVLIPIVRDRPPARHAIGAFRMFEALQPWAMAEIFAIGCAVALVKIGDMATVTFGPAFWMFGVLVVLLVAQDGFMSRWMVWNALYPLKKS